MPQKQNAVFVWNDYQQWRKVVLRLLSDLVDKSVLDELRRNPPNCFATDKFEWLDNAIQKTKGLSHSDVCSTILERFQNHYSFVRGFHGCRAESIESYKQNGLMPCDPASLDEKARQIFQGKEAVELAIKDLDSGFSSYREHNQGKVCFCIQWEHLVEDCGHYLLFGSEYLLCIAARVNQEHVVRKIGRATIVECNVPTTDIPIGYLKCLVGCVLSKIAQKYCNRRRQTAKVIVFGFEVPHKLEPQNIIGFRFPTRIPNPHNFNFLED